jgi:lipid-A-disaccharide synthase
VRKIFPVMIETARLLLQAKPTLHFEVAAASEQLAREMNEMLELHLRPLPLPKGEATEGLVPGESPIERTFSSSKEKQAGASGSPDELKGNRPGRTPLPSSRGEGSVRGASQERQAIQIKLGETAALMQRAFVGMVASGSATLEATYFRMPFVLIYKVAWPTYLAARLVVNVDYLGMPNLLAGKEVVPEFIQHRAEPRAIAKAVQRLMEDARAREQMISEFDAVMGKLGKGAASQKAARAIVEELSRKKHNERTGASRSGGL